MTIVNQLSSKFTSVRYNTKAKHLLEKNTKDFFMSVLPVTGGTNYTAEYIEELNSILYILDSESIITLDTSDDCKFPNGLSRISEIHCGDDMIIEKTKHNLLRPRKVVDYVLNLKDKVHEQSVFLEDETTPFDTLVALKYLKKKQQAKERGIEFSLTLAQLSSIMRSKRCFYSGVPLTLDGVNSLTLDRIDATKGYVKGNVVACSGFVNGLKENLIDSGVVLDNLDKKEVKKMLLSFIELL